MAHLWDPRAVAPYSVMPSYPWFFDEARRPTARALGLVAYLQWLGSWRTEEERGVPAQGAGSEVP
jgi:cbb3-type cytochrome oxidase cytochrome c subunit